MSIRAYKVVRYLRSFNVLTSWLLDYQHPFALEYAMGCTTYPELKGSGIYCYPDLHTAHWAAMMTLFPDLRVLEVEAEPLDLDFLEERYGPHMIECRSRAPDHLQFFWKGDCPDLLRTHPHRPTLVCEWITPLRFTCPPFIHPNDWDAASGALLPHTPHYPPPLDNERYHEGVSNGRRPDPNDLATHPQIGTGTGYPL